MSTHEYSTITDLFVITSSRVGAETVPTVSARDLYTYLALTSDYHRWIHRAIKSANLVENEDFIIYHEVVDSQIGKGRPIAEHHLTFDAAKHIAMMSSKEKGHAVRQWFIDKEKALRDMQQTLPRLKNPTNQLLLEAVVRIDALEVEQAAQRDALIEQQSILLEQQAKMIEAFKKAQQAQDTAALALAEMHYLRVEEYVMKTGNIRQYPEAMWGAMGRWLTTYSNYYNLPIRSMPVVGKRWKEENAYQLTAFAAMDRARPFWPTQGDFLDPADAPPPEG